jgi:hypothetical protein
VAAVNVAGKDVPPFCAVKGSCLPADQQEMAELMTDQQGMAEQ